MLPDGGLERMGKRVVNLHAGWKQRFRKGRFFIMGGFVLALAGTLVCAFALAGRNGSTNSRSVPSKSQLAEHNEDLSQGRVLSGKTEFGQFSPGTEAERELEKMLRGKDEDIDLALANWLIAADIPEFRDLTRAAYFERLNTITELVREDMARRRNVARTKGKNPNDPDTRCAIFCGAILNLGFAYAEGFRTEDSTLAAKRRLYEDANNIFLTGLLRTRRGSCVSMPLIYLVIGRRLGFPVYLVAIGRHYFIRWEEPGFRLNIERPGSTTLP